MSNTPAGKNSRAPDDAVIRLRRERKRTTDRAAQREHRRRQKLYVEELEAQLALVREGNAGEQVAQLMKENERLQKELTKYRGFFNSVEDLIMDEWQQDNNMKNVLNPTDTSMRAAETDLHLRPSNSPSTAGNCNPDGTESASTASIVVTHPPSVVERPGVVISNGSTVLPSEGRTWNHMSPQGAFDWSTSHFEFEPLQHSHPQPDTQPNAALWNGNTRSIDQTNSSNLLGTAAGPFVSDDPVERTSPQDDLAISLPFPNLFSHQLNELDPALIFATERQPGPLIHQLLPRILDPQSPEDQQIQSIIERARNHNIRLDSPTLADFLCENPDNILSMAIKHYLEPVRRTRRTIEFLATYWVLYLLLRWQINRDEESFYNVPTWLRPSVTQTRVQHPIATDLLAWPLLRDELIMISLKGSDLPREILADVGLNLEVDIPLHKFSLHHDVDSLHAAISDLNNWRLNEGFFQKHLSLRQLYESSFHPGS